MSAVRWVRYSARSTARYSGRSCSAEIDRRPETVDKDIDLDSRGLSAPVCIPINPNQFSMHRRLADARARRRCMHAPTTEKGQP